MLKNQAFPAAGAAAVLQCGVALSLAVIWHRAAGSTVAQSVHQRCHWHSPLWHRNCLGKLCLAVESSVALGALGSWCSCQWHKPLISSEVCRQCPCAVSCLPLQASSVPQSVAGLWQAAKQHRKWKTKIWDTVALCCGN